jgi:hypothetical protein
MCGFEEAGEGDEVDSGIAFDGDQRVTFDFAGFEQSCVGPREGFIAIARMGDEFKCALRHGRDERVNDGKLEGACGENSDGAVGGHQALLGNDTAETRLEPAKKEHLCAAGLGSMDCCVDAPERLKGIAHRANSGGPGGTQYRAQHQRKHVHVLVSVDVGEAQSVALKQCDLRGGFGFNFGRTNAGSVETLEKLTNGWVKPAGGAIDEGGDAVRIGSRNSGNQDNVAADAEGGHGEGHVYGFVNGCGPRHECRAGKNFGSVEFENGAVDSGGHPEIVGIDDKAGHGDSLSTAPEKRFAMWWMGAVGRAKGEFGGLI